MYRDLTGIVSILRKTTGGYHLQATRRIAAVFAAHPEFFLNPRDAHKLRIELYKIVHDLVGDAERASETVEALIRDQSASYQTKDNSSIALTS